MKKKIIVAEDDPDISYIIKVILNNEGYDVESVESGKNLIELKNDFPDLYILDKQMPDMDGIEVCKYLKSNKDTEKIPIIMVSASPGFGQRIQEMAIGVEDYLEKPFQMRDLIRKVAKFLR